MKDLAQLVESNRFVGREFLLWLWFESEIFETNLEPSDGQGISLWMEKQLTLADEGEEARIKAGSPGTAPESKQALRQGKLPTATRFRAVLGGAEFEWAMKADELSIAGLKVPGTLDAKEDRFEALYDRMRLVETLEARLERLYRDFVILRLDAAWEKSIVLEMKKWARGKEVDVTAYRKQKERLVRPARASAS